MSDLLTRDEAVAHLRVSERSFARHVAPGLASVRIGSRILYRLDEVERWLRK